MSGKKWWGRNVLYLTLGSESVYHLGGSAAISTRMSELSHGGDRTRSDGAEGRGVQASRATRRPLQWRNLLRGEEMVAQRICAVWIVCRNGLTAVWGLAVPLLAAMQGRLTSIQESNLVQQAHTYREDRPR